MCPPLSWGGAPLIPLITFFLPVFPGFVPYGPGVGVSGSIFHVVWRSPSHTVSPPLVPVTWAGSLLPRSRATSPCIRPALGQARGGGLSGHSSHTHPPPPPWWRRWVEGEVSGSCSLESNLGVPAKLPGILFPGVTVVFNWMSGICLAPSS